MQKWLIFIGLGVVFFTNPVFSAFDDEPYRLEETYKEIAKTKIAVYTTPVRLHKSLGVFVYSHGMTSRVIFHNPLLKSAYDAGYDVIAYDLPGHGDSERTLGLKGGVQGFDQLLNVLDGVVQEGRQIFSNDRVVLSGWSLGGLITTIYLQKNPQVAKASVLFAPGISLALFDGDWSIIGGVLAENLVHDKEFAKTLTNDPGFFRFPPPCILEATLKGEYERNPKLYSTPTLLFMAGQDAFVSVNTVQKFYQDAQINHGFELLPYYFPGSKHDLENDINSDAVLKITHDYLAEDVINY